MLELKSCEHRRGDREKRQGVSHKDHRTSVEDFRLPEGRNIKFWDKHNFPLL